jgi:hypothetical protein
MGLLNPYPDAEPHDACVWFLDVPERARTDSSEASSTRRLIVVTERKTPGSIGGGIAWPGLGKGSGGAEDMNALCKVSVNDRSV